MRLRPRIILLGLALAGCSASNERQAPDDLLSLARSLDTVLFESGEWANKRQWSGGGHHARGFEAVEHDGQIETIVFDPICHGDGLMEITAWCGGQLNPTLPRRAAEWIRDALRGSDPISRRFPGGAVTVLPRDGEHQGLTLRLSRPVNPIEHQPRRVPLHVAAVLAHQLGVDDLASSEKIMTRWVFNNLDPDTILQGQHDGVRVTFYGLQDCLLYFRVRGTGTTLRSSRVLDTIARAAQPGDLEPVREWIRESLTIKSGHRAFSRARVSVSHGREEHEPWDAPKRYSIGVCFAFRSEL